MNRKHMRHLRPYATVACLIGLVDAPALARGQAPNAIPFARHTASAQKQTTRHKLHPASLHPASIVWSGLRWNLKDSHGMQAGPGPNVFDPQNAFVDRAGNLHLKITHHNGRWQSAEIVAANSARFGYGTYEWVLGNADRLAPNEVLGLFTWDNTSPAEHHREIDIELSQAFRRDPRVNAQFTVQPWTRSSNQDGFHLPAGAQTSIQSFIWEPGKVTFRTIVGHAAKPVRRWTYRGSDNPHPAKEQVRCNLWILGSAPSDRKETEIILRRFRFTPLEQAR